MKNECNCSICENNEYDGINRMNLQETKKYIKENKMFLDRRTGYLTRYNYCPFYGKKIDWKNIKKELIKNIGINNGN